MMKTALLLLALAASVSAHGRLLKPTTRDMLNNKRVDEMNAPVPGDSNFICRNFPRGPVQATLNAGGSLTVQWSYSAAHVGDCSAYLSYDGEQTWFKIWNLFDCKAANNQDVQIQLPSYLPACDNCVLRWEWIALHQWPATELYAQCVDVRITGSGSSLPATYRIPGHLPQPGGNAYRNPFGSGDTRIAGPAIASGPGGVPVPPPSPPPPGQTPPPPPPPPANNGGTCYSNPALARNINGPINQQCSAPSRCPDGQCCSQFGFCGTSGDHCNGQSNGDWRTTACNVPTGQCYRAGTPNLNGPINANSACGQNAPGSRCDKNNCCSQYGYCGTSDAHCNQNQGDWRLVPCSGGNNIQARDAIYNNNTSPVDLGDTNALIEGNSAGQLAAVGVLAVLAAL